MVANVIIAIFMAIVLMDQSSANEGDDLMEAVMTCIGNLTLTDNDDRVYQACFFDKTGIINEKNEFDSSRAEELFTSLDEDNQARKDALKILNECASAATGHTREEIVNNYRDCVATKDKMIGDDMKLIEKS